MQSNIRCGMWLVLLQRAAPAVPMNETAVAYKLRNGYPRLSRGSVARKAKLTSAHASQRAAH